MGDWADEARAERRLLWDVIEWARSPAGELDDILAANERSRSRRIQLELLRRLAQRPPT